MQEQNMQTSTTTPKIKKSPPRPKSEFHRLMVSALEAGRQKSLDLQQQLLTQETKHQDQLSLLMSASEQLMHAFRTSQEKSEQLQQQLLEQEIRYQTEMSQLMSASGQLLNAFQASQSKVQELEVQLQQLLSVNESWKQQFQEREESHMLRIDKYRNVSKILGESVELLSQQLNSVSEQQSELRGLFGDCITSLQKSGRI